MNVVVLGTMSEMEEGEIKMVSSQRKKQATGGTLMGVGVALLGFELEFLPDLGSLGQTQVLLGALAVGGLVAVGVFAMTN
jgi:hypothetical protein